MTWSRGRAAAALAVGVLSALGNAQAYFGGDQSAVCDASQDFVDVGCYLGDMTTITPFTPVNYDPSNPFGSYPGFDTGTNFNATVTPQTCVQTCRGYGYRTASLLAGTCRCGTTAPTPIPATLGGTCTFPCGGDASQFCGGATDTQIYVDPSFADPAALSGAPPADVASHYAYLGCFHQTNNFVTEDEVNTITNQPTIDNCLAQCALLQYTLVEAVYAP